MLASNPCEHLSNNTVAARTIEAERLRRRRAGSLHQKPPQHCPPTRQTCLDHVLGYSETLGDFGGAQPFNLSKHEYFAHTVGQCIDRPFQEPSELACECLTLGTVRGVAGHEWLHVREVVVKRLVPASTADASQGLINRDPREPRRKLR